MSSPEGPVASATQEWVHVTADLALAKASDGLADAFQVEEGHDGPIELPAFEPIEGARSRRFELECWQTWMDPLAHVNHPAYVDWCDEAISRVMAEVGLDPVRLAPVAERAQFKSGVVAGDRVSIRTQLVGRTDAGEAVFQHQVAVGERSCAKVTAVRRLVGELGRTELLALA